MRMTIELPAHRIARLQAILDDIPPTQKRTTVKKWHKLLGELRSMVIALPGARGLFSLLQEALRHQADKRIRLSAGIHDCLAGFRWLQSELATRPTRLHELVPQSAPELIGACDASGLGMGGVWFPVGAHLRARTAIHDCEGEPLAGTSTNSPLQSGPAQIPPLVWQAKFPSEIAQRLVSSRNPRGDITNSDLELTASLVAKDVAAQHFDIRERTIANGSDNLPTVYWQRKGSTTTTSAPAYLLRAQALHQRYHRQPPGFLLIRAPRYFPQRPRRCAASVPSRNRGFSSRRHRPHLADLANLLLGPLRRPLAYPWLAEVGDSVLLLQVFAHRYRTGLLAPSGRTVRSRTVEGALRAVGQTLASVGADDPRLDAAGKTEFRLGRQLRSYAKADAPPSRVKPLPIQVVHHAINLAHAHGHVESLAVVNMITIGFFFLMRPDEHTAPTGENTPFKLQDLQLYVGPTRYSALTIPVPLLVSVTFVTYTFTIQKNSVRGEVVGLGRSGHHRCCPVEATANRVQHLRSHNVPADTPLCTYFSNNQSYFVTSSDLTSTICSSVAAIGPALGFAPADVSARSLRAVGAMALLCANVDPNTIRMLGWWRSDEMLRYLHLQAQPLMHNFAQRMLTGGHYTLHPNPQMPPP